MICAEALPLLLEADPGALADWERDDTDLARHLRGCPRCRTSVERILAADAALREDLAVAPPDSAEASRRAPLEAQHRSHRRRQLWQAGGPLAAAAVLAGVLVMRHGPSEHVVVPAATTAPGYRGVTVTAPPGRNVAVLNSDSSDVVVIWFF